MNTTLMREAGTAAPAGAAPQFDEEGYLGPLPILTKAECRRFLDATNNGRVGPGLDWGKSCGVVSRTFYDLAHHPRILEALAPLLGDDFLLWGALVVSRGPGVIHPWHSDIESATCGGRTVSVWIGLENTTRDSALLLLPRTHLLGVTIQQVAHENGRGRRQTTDEDVMRWAQERDPRSRCVRSDMGDGDALLFDGRLWHGSNNRFSGTRRALLLQYATPDAAVRMPDENFFEWPFRHFEAPRPPCIMVQGKGDPTVNRLVPGPLPTASDESCDLHSRIHPLPIPLPSTGEDGWKVHRMFNGATANLQHLTCHTSALAPGKCPHPPHGHAEEELLLVLDGEVDLLLPDTDGGRVRLTAGEFVYYPAHFVHSLETVGDVPANYLMFKWHNERVATDADSPLGFGRWPFQPSLDAQAAGPGFHPRRVFDGPTRWLRKLHCHATTLTPGAGYPAHADAYDVAIVVLAGEVETLGTRAKPFDVIFYRAGEAHGMSNPGSEPAHYLVFEFHGRAHPVPDVAAGYTGLLGKLMDRRRWKRKLRQAARRVLGRR